MADQEFYKNELVEISGIIEYANNARQHSDSQVDELAMIIERFGFTNPILVDENHNLIAGHGRILAANKLGMVKVPAVIVAGLSEKERKLLIIADNKMGLNSSWDDDLLLVELQSFGSDLELAGFTTSELSDLLNLVDEVDFPDLPDGDKEPFQQITFTLHDEQHAIVKDAVALARTNPLADTGINENANGNAIAYICEQWLEMQQAEPEE